MADYSNFTDIDIRYSSEFKELYYLALFCLQHNEDFIDDRPLDHAAMKHLRDRFLELVVFPMLRHVPHPLVSKYTDSSFEVKPDFTEVDLSTIKSDLASWATINNLSGSDFTTAFQEFKDTLEANNPYTVDASQATTS
jgi:hypothetical protein